MREAFGPPLRAAAMTAFIAGLLLLFLNPPSLAGLGELVSLLAGALAIVLVTAWVTTRADRPGDARAASSRKLEESKRGARLACRPPSARRPSSTSS